MKSSWKAGVGCLLLLLYPVGKPLPAQSTSEEATGFGEIELAAPVSALPFPCDHPVSCEGLYDSVRVRVWHAYGLIQRVDVIYQGKRLETGQEIQSSPLTLPQAVRSHSIRYGRKTPRMGFGGNAGGARIIVDFANGIAYFADSGYVTSHVREVRYLPMDDPLIVSARVSPLSEHAEWLMKAARSAERYKNLLADDAPTASEPSPAKEAIRPEEITSRLERLSSEARVYAQATMMLSERVMESLEKHEAPDPLVSARLKKAFARMSATTSEALCMVNHHPQVFTAQDRAALPLELAGEARARMKELTKQGFGESF